MSEAIVEKRPPMPPSTRRFAFPSRTAFLSQAALLEEAGPPRMPAMVCLLGFAFIAIAIVAGMLIQIDVVTSSTGRIVAAEGNHVLQSFDGGIVDRIAVEEGQIVERGDLLATLMDPEAKAQLDRLLDREAALFAQVRRLQALLSLPSIDPIEGFEPSNAITDEQMSILRFEESALAAEQALVDAEIDRRAKAFQDARSLEKDAQFRLSLIQDKLRSDRQLAAKGLLAKSELVDIERQAIDAASELKEIEGQIREAEASLAESIRRLDNVVAGKRQRHADNLSSTLIDLNETRQQIHAMRRRLDRGLIKAPANGIVMEVKVGHRGETVAPGDPVIEIIPIDGGLLAETRLLPSEISHIRSGQPVRIAVDGLEPHRHGYLDGEIASVSPSTFVDENGMPYYRASIELEHDHLDGMPLTPGMTLQGQIKTGQRTILEYLLKPVYRAWSTAFRER